MIYNWPDINLTEFKEANTFANGLLRGSVEFNEVDHATLTNEGNLRFKIDYERNATKTPSFRVEFTEAPWMKRFTDGTTDEYIWEYIFPSDYKKALTPVSLFQMYCRWADGGGVMCQLELSREGQIAGAKQGQIQMIYNAGPDKYRELTPFNPGPGERLHFKVTCKHGVDGYLKVEINELIVFDRLCNTVFMSNPEANAQAKWGIYHHALKAEFGPANNQKHLDAGHKYIAVEMSPLTIHRNLPSIIVKPTNDMRHVTADTLQQDNETFRRFLEPNGWTLKDGDYLVAAFAKDDNLIVSASVIKQEGATIYFVSNELPTARSLTISGTWTVKSVKVRVLGDVPVRVKADSTSSYGPIKLFGPESFDVQFDNAQLKYGLVCTSEGMLKNHGMQFDCAKGGDFRLSGINMGGGNFSQLRLCERGSTTDPSYTNKVSGIVENFILHNSLSEGIYAGSVKKFHTKLNVTIRNGKILNAGSEALQAQNFGGDRAIIENLTIVNSACEFPSPFQNYQVGGIQIKAGGGNLKVRNIYIENGGMPTFNLFASAPVYDTAGTLIQEGSKSGDVIEFDNIHCPSMKGNWVYFQPSCSNGAEWKFDRIYCGGANNRISVDTETKLPHAFLNDIFSQVTDSIVVKNITTDGSLPLVGKSGAKYNVQNHVVAPVPFAKFKKPFPGKDVLAFYNVYNEVSQSQFYPVAGKPVKYKKDDLTFKNTVHNPIEWRMITEDCTSANLKSIPVTFTVDYDQTEDSPLRGIVGEDPGTLTPDPEPTEPTYEQLKLQNMELKEQITAIQMQLETLKDEATALETKNTELSEAVAVEVQKREAFTQQIRDILTQLES